MKGRIAHNVGPFNTSALISLKYRQDYTVHFMDNEEQVEFFWNDKNHKLVGNGHSTRNHSLCFYLLMELGFSNSAISNILFIRPIHIPHQI